MNSTRHHWAFEHYCISKSTSIRASIRDHESDTVSLLKKMKLKLTCATLLASIVFHSCNDSGPIQNSSILSASNSSPLSNGTANSGANTHSVTLYSSRVTSSIQSSSSVHSSSTSLAPFRQAHADSLLAKVRDTVFVPLTSAQGMHLTNSGESAPYRFYYNPIYVGAPTGQSVDSLELSVLTTAFNPATLDSIQVLDFQVKPLSSTPYTVSTANHKFGLRCTATSASITRWVKATDGLASNDGGSIVAAISLQLPDTLKRSLAAGCPSISPLEVILGWTVKPITTNFTIKSLRLFTYDSTANMNYRRYMGQYGY